MIRFDTKSYLNPPGGVLPLDSDAKQKSFAVTTRIPLIFNYSPAGIWTPYNPPYLLIIVPSRLAWAWRHRLNKAKR